MCAVGRLTPGDNLPLKVQVVFQSQIPIQEHEFGVIVHPTMVLIHMEDTEVEGDIAQHVYEPKAIPHVTALRQQCELIQVARIVRLKLQLYIGSIKHAKKNINHFPSLK